jgi:hypothetical protein
VNAADHAVMDIQEFLSRASPKEIVDRIVSLSASSDEASFAALRDFLVNCEQHPPDRHSIPHLASRALLKKGVRGVQTLISALPEAPGATYPTVILESLWHAGRGSQPPDYLLGLLIPGSSLDGEFSDETIAAARQAFHDLVVESYKDEELFDRLMAFLNRTSMYLNTPGQGNIFRSQVFEVFSEATIKLTSRLISAFETLIERNESEEVYQRFLMENPVLIDPLASEIVPKQKLGVEFVTDFVVRRLDNEYVLVEIERPQDDLFTSSHDFTSRFTHAIGQIIDFQEWVDQHGEYARTLMPGISSPKGLLLMGRRPRISERQASKLKRYSQGLSAVDILTYDDLLTRAKDFYRNIHRSISEIEGSD